MLTFSSISLMPRGKQRYLSIFFFFTSFLSPSPSPATLAIPSNSSNSSNSRTQITTMTITGVHLEPVPAASPDLATYTQLTGLNILKLYRLEYIENFPRGIASMEWSPVHFFHGTGHCGCLAQHVSQTLSDKIATPSWCSSLGCAVRGILNHGYVFQLRQGMSELCISALIIQSVVKVRLNTWLPSA